MLPDTLGVRVIMLPDTLDVRVMCGVHNAT